MTTLCSSASIFALRNLISSLSVAAMLACPGCDAERNLDPPAPQARPPPRAGRRTIGRLVAYDVFLRDCPARTTLDLVADTWSLIAIVALGAGPSRYSELRDRIGGISNKMLTTTPHKLQANGLVAKRALATAPPGTEYRLTALGETLLEPGSAP